MKRWTLVLLILGIAAGIVLVWPAPDPLQGVETVAIATPSGETTPLLPPEVFDGLEIVLNDRQIRIVSDPSQADAVLTLVPEEVTVRIRSETGLEARARFLLTKDGRRYRLDLVVTLNEQGLTARLVTRRFWE